MPFLSVRTNAVLDESAVAPLLKDCSRLVANLLGKPESYVMTTFDRVVGMTMAGSVGPACFLEVRSLGKMTSSQTKALSDVLCKVVSDHTGVVSERIYLNFIEFSGSMWGYDGGTFC